MHHESSVITWNKSGWRVVGLNFGLVVKKVCVVVDFSKFN